MLYLWNQHGMVYYFWLYLFARFVIDKGGLPLPFVHNSKDQCGFQKRKKTDSGLNAKEDFPFLRFESILGTEFTLSLGC